MALADGPDKIARIGSDEFAIIQPDTSGLKHAEIFGSRIVDALSGTYQVVGHEVVSSASVGIAVAPDHGKDALRLLKSADLALHQIKGLGRGKKVLYSADMDQSMQSRLELQSILRKAFENNWFELHYQPQYDLGARRLTGFEALLRLRHPERGMIPPVEFIPVAEESGLILPIGEWIIREACATAAQWPDHLSLAINLSPAQIHDNKLAGTIKKILSQSGLPARRLEVEITEGLLMDATDTTMSELDQLKEIGLSLVMDDFGTGYSSLSYLWRFEFDKIKIDRSFVHNLGTGRNVESLLKSIINIGQSLDLRVIAEGVEKPEQAHFLMKNACHHVQGFLFGRPVPKAEVASIITKDMKNNTMSHDSNPGIGDTALIA
jgi:EAL domain-containing protein (putative c-di-GMP-specific phosphodiesterase class I)